MVERSRAHNIVYKFLRRDVRRGNSSARRLIEMLSEDALEFTARMIRGEVQEKFGSPNTKDGRLSYNAEYLKSLIQGYDNRLLKRVLERAKKSYEEGTVSFDELREICICQLATEAPPSFFDLYRTNA